MNNVATSTVSRKPIMADKNTLALPTFPNFKPITYSDKDAFEALTHSFDTFSDFNFNSFYSWNTSATHEVSQLNGNLVLKFSDYITGDPFFSFFGTNKVAETINALQEYAEKQQIDPTLKLIPHTTIESLSEVEEFHIDEDPENFDYIFSITDLSELKGRQFKSKRRAAKKCVHDDTVTTEDWSDKNDTQPHILELLKQWEKEKVDSGKEVDMEPEYVAVERILKNLTDQENLFVTVATKDGKLAGFSVDEVLPNKYALSHYFKTLPTVQGLSEYLNMEVAKKLKGLGCEYWNWEQDLGIESLKRMKLSHRPIGHQKKFSIKKK